MDSPQRPDAHHTTCNELFDLVDENDRVIGTVRRGEAHRDKTLIHRSVGIAVFNSRGELFMQKRSAAKDMDPLTWTISCSGHVGSGQTYEEAAHRELGEELGIDLPLQAVGKYLIKAPEETEMSMLYRAASEGPFVLQEEEIAEGMFMSPSRFRRIAASGRIRLSFMGAVAMVIFGWLTHEEAVIQLDNYQKKG